MLCSPLLGCELPRAGPASTGFCNLHSQQQHTGAPGTAKKKAPGVGFFLDLFITSSLNMDIFLKLGQEDWAFFFHSLLDGRASMYI